MLNDTQLNRFMKKFDLSSYAKNYITKTRSTAPHRLVGRYAEGNVCSWFFSHKLGHLISSESSTGELYFILESEYSNDVFEYWDQPPPVEIHRMTSRGHRIRTRYTPDFLVLQKSGVVVVEIKSKHKLEELTKKNPADWTFINSKYSDNAAKEAFKKLGLKHVVISSDSFNHVYAANLKLLIKSRHQEVDKAEQLSILKELRKLSWISIHELQQKLKLKSIDSIVSLIGKGSIYGQVKSKLITAKKSFFISPSKKLLNIYEKEFEDLQVMHTSGETVSREIIPSKKDIQEACRKLKIIESGTNNSSVRRWKKQIKDDAKKGIRKFQSLTPKTHLKGNRNHKISEESLKILTSFIKNHFAIPSQPSISRSYEKYELHIEHEHPHIHPVSLTTFTKYIHNLDLKTLHYNRSGKRAYNSKKPPTDVNERKIKAQLPFEYAGIDHYLAKTEIVIFNKNGIKRTARPWITSIFDEYSGSEIGTCITFSHPSRNSIALALRDCVRRFNKVPDELIADRGAEFRSRYALELSAYIGFSYSLRPSGDSRFGGLTERLFGEFTSFVLDGKNGSFKKNVYSRSTSRSHSPKNLSSLDITEFYELFIEYLNWRPKRPIHYTFETPGSIIEKKSNLTRLAGIYVKNDIQFQIATAIEAKAYTVDPARGIHLDGVHYWSPRLADIKGRTKKVEVRVEPQNPYIVYALINSNWHVCEATKLQEFNSLSIPEKLSKAATIRELRKYIGEIKKEANKQAIESFNHAQISSLDTNPTPQYSSQEHEKSADPFVEANSQPIKPLKISTWEEKS